ncbi:putative ribonuclease H-like domain-containing protein [Tanacetum coccineum]
MHRLSISTASPSISTARHVCTARPSINTARPICTARPSINTARPVCTTRPSVSTARPVYVTRPTYPRMDNVRPRGSCSPIKRSYYTKPAFRPKDLKQDVKTFGVKNMTTAGTRAVVNTGKGKLDTDLKKSRWVWRPKGNYLDHVSKDSGSFMLKKGNPEILLQDHAVVDSGCSSHMTGNKAYLSDYEDFNGGFVAFGSDPKGGKITGKGKIKTANLDFDDVYFVDELKFNLFSVSQMCDKKNSVLFTESECLILSPSFKLLDESQVVLRAPRKDDVYSLDLKNIVPSGGITCLYANATADESKLWHRRLGHVNFKNINKLVKGHLVRGLPSKVFVNNHTCVACKKGKQHKASCKAKLERIITKPLELLHMDLFGPVSVESINKKRCDNGTKFKNHAMNEFCAKKGIKREFSMARTPQQNGVAERKNRTLIEAARTMLADSLLPIPFWAEAVNTACYVLNRVLVTKPQNKTPYELLIGNSPSISFMRPFGCPLTILNTLDSLGKFDGKSDEGYLLGYSTSSKAFRVYNKRTKRVEENLHINFLEDQPNVTGTGPNWMFDLDFLTNSMNYIPVSVENQVNMDEGTQDSYVVVKDVPPAAHEKPSESSPKDNDVQDTEDAANKEEQHQMKESEQDLQDELEKMVTQELVAKAMDDVSRQAFEEEKRRIASQKKAAQATSTNILSPDRPSVSTDRPSVSIASTPTGTNAGESSFVYLSGKIPIDASTLPNADLPVDLNMPDLEDTSDTLPNDGIFNGAYDDDEDVGAVVDFNNMDNTVAVSPIPTLRIHKDHPRGQILGDPTSAVQTRGKIQKASSAQQANWVEAMQEELLQFKLQKVGYFVEIALGKSLFGTEFEECKYKRNSNDFPWVNSHYIWDFSKAQPDGIFIIQDQVYDCSRKSIDCLKADIMFAVYTMADVNVNASAEQAPAMATPTRTDDQILPRSSWVPFWDTVRYVKKTGSYSCQLDEQWFDLTKDTLRDALQITPVDNNNPFSSPPTPDALINFVNELGYPKVVKTLSAVHKFHPRPDSPLHLPYEEYVLGYLKFSAKGTKREVFGMPIPNDLITDDIRVSDPNSPAPKPAKATKPKATKQSKPQPPKPTPATTEPSKKDQSKKRKLVKESSEAPSPAKRPKAGVPDKEPVYGDEDADTQRAIEESLKEVHDAHQGPLPPVVIREPDSGKFQPLPNIQGKGKEKVSAVLHQLNLQARPNPGIQDEGQVGSNPGDAVVSHPQSSLAVHAGPNCEHIDIEVTDASIQQNPEKIDEEFTTTAYPNVQENLKLPTKDQVRLEEPASSARTLSSLLNLDKELSFAD